MRINELGGNGPFYSADGLGSGGSSQRPSGGQSPLEKLFVSRAVASAWTVFKRSLPAAELSGNIKTLDDGSLEISPKRLLKNLGKKSKIPKGFIQANINVLNAYYERKSLGKFSFTENSGVYKVSFEASNDTRAIQTQMASSRDPMIQILAEAGPIDKARTISKQDAFILHQTLELLEGAQNKYILAPVNMQEKGISVKFDRNFDSYKFFERFSYLSDSADDLVIDLGLSAQRSRDDTDFFRIKFQPNWSSELYLNADEWYTDENMGKIEAAFNVRLPEELS